MVDLRSASRAVPQILLREFRVLLDLPLLVVAYTRNKLQKLVYKGYLYELQSFCVDSAIRNIPTLCHDAD